MHKVQVLTQEEQQKLVSKKLDAKPFTESARQSIKCEVWCSTCCYHFRLGLGISGQNQARTITQGKTICDVQGLEMLGLAGSRRHSCLLRPKQGIDGGGLANIGVASEPDCHPPMVSLQTISDFTASMRQTGSQTLQ